LAQGVSLKAFCPTPTCSFGVCCTQTGMSRLGATSIATRLAFLCGALLLLVAVAADGQAEEVIETPETTAAPVEDAAAAVEATAAPAEATAAPVTVTAAPALRGTASPASTTKIAADDMPLEGACKAALERLCASVEAGNGQKAHCLRAESIAAKARKEKPLSDLCRHELREFFVSVAKEEPGSPLPPGKLFRVEPVPGIREACSDDAWMLCQQKTGPQLLGCLRQQRIFKALGSACDAKVAESMRHTAQDIRLDRPLALACKGDLRDISECQELPKLSPPGAKRACLKKHRDELSEKCKNTMFQRGIEESEDIRFDADIFRFCKADVSSFCNDKEFGEARILKCLWENRMKPSFSNMCKSRVNLKTRHSLADYRLDWRIRTRCEADISALCHEAQLRVDHLSATELFGSYWQDDGKSGEVLRCLKANLTQIKTAACSSEVKRMVRVQSEDASADAILMRRCNADIQEHCAEEPTNLHACLRKNLKVLREPCRKAELLQGELESTGIHLKPLVQRVCTTALSKFCRTAPDGVRAIQCLQDKMEEEDFPWACRRVVEADLETSNQDWRLKFGIATECKGEAERLCTAEVKVGGGKVLTCLKAKRHNITEKACTAEMTRYAEQGAKNIKLAPHTYEVCADDVAQFCNDVEPGEGRVHQCLLKHQSGLTADCAKAEFEEQRIISEDIKASPLAKKACSSTSHQLCRDAGKEAGKVWQCLEDKKDVWGMALACRAVVTAREQLKNFEFYLNPNLASHCEAEASRLCPAEMVLASYKDFSSEGSVISCLIRHRQELQDTTCSTTLLRKQVQRVSNMNNSAEARWSCKSDVNKFCPQVKGHGRGKELKCLWEHHTDISKPCLGVVSHLQAMKSEDIRLNPKMRRHCAAAIKEFCADHPVGSGGGRTIRCLLQHMHEDSMDQECRDDLGREQQKRSISIRFNPRLKKSCETDLKRLQGLYSNEACPEQDPTTFDGASIACLAKHHSEVITPACKAAVTGVMRLRSNDWRASARFRVACKADRETLCKDVLSGKGRVVRCLRQHKASIKDPKCLAMVERVKAAETEDSTLNPHIRGRCQTEMKVFCSRVERGGSRMLTCLGLNKNKTSFSVPCAEALISSGLKANLLAAAVQQKQSAEAKVFTKEVVRYLEDHRHILDEWAGVLITMGITVVTGCLAGIAYFALQWNRRKNKEAYTVVVAKEMGA